MKEQLAAAEQTGLDFEPAAEAPPHVQARAKLSKEAGNLLDLRRLSGFTQQRFADLIGASRGALSNWEQDRVKMPDRLAAFAAQVMRRVDWSDKVTCSPGVVSSFTKEPRGIFAKAVHTFEPSEVGEPTPDRVEDFAFPGLPREGKGKGRHYH